MASEFDLAFGNLAIGRGLVSREHVQAAYAQLQPGQSLAGALVQLRLLTPDAASALEAELRGGSAALHADSQLTAVTAHATMAPPLASGSDEARLPTEGEVVAERYRVVATLGRGGMGAVFRATDLSRNVDVALKVMLPSADASGNALIRFEREAQAVTRVDGHAGVVRVLDFGLHGLLPYAAQDLVEGQDLKSLIRERGALPLERALEIGEAVSRAIAHCHEHSVLHRDLKPANILIRGEDGQPFVTDFGLALEQDAQERLTKTGEVLGTPAYMSPEQADGRVSSIDARTDVYALGAVVFEAVTGRPPFEGGGLIVLKKVLLDLPPPPSTLRDGLPPELDLILAKALAKRQADRYASAGDFADDLAALRRGDPVTVKPPSRLQHFKWQLTRRDRRAFTKLGAAIVLLAALGSSPWLVAEGRKRLIEIAAQNQLERLPGLLATESPFAEESEVRQVLHELLAKERELSGVTKDTTSDEERRARWRALEQGQERETPLGRLVHESSDEVRLAFRHAVRRTLTRSGHGWTTGAPDGAEAMRLEAMALLGWKAKTLAGVDLPRARGLLERAGEGKLVQRLDEIARKVDQNLEAGVEATRGLFRPRRSALTWGALDRERLTLGPLKRALDGYLLAKKPKAARRAFAIVREAVPKIPKSGELNRRQLARWQSPDPYTAIRAWYTEQLTVLLKAQPAIQVELDWTELAIDITRCAIKANAGSKWPSALIAYSALLISLQAHIDWHNNTFRSACANLVFYRAQKLLEGNQPPPLDLIHFFPRMKLLPSSHMDGLVLAYRKSGLFRQFLAKHESGDAYLIYAQGLYIASSQRRNENGAELLELWARALGDALNAAERAALGLGETHQVALKRPVSREWIPWAKFRLADLVFRTHGTKLRKRRGGAVDVERCRAALDLLRSLQETAFVKRGGRLQYLDQRMEWLLAGSKLFKAQGLAREGAQLLEEALRVGREAQGLANRLHAEAVAPNKQERQGSLIEVDIAHDPDKIENVWSRITRSLQHLHQLKGEIDQVLAVTTALQDPLKRRRNRINAAAEIGLYGVLVQAPEERWKKDRKAWEAQVRAVADDVAARRPGDRRAREKWFGKHDMIVHRVAEFRYRNHDLDGVLTQFKRARAINGARDSIWGDLLGATLLGLLAKKRYRDARWLANAMKGTQAEKQPGFSKALDALAKAKGNQ